MKVNVWQVGYATYRDFVLRDSRKAVCRLVGYVEIEPCDNWQEKVWDFLNWGCWTKHKPSNVHSYITHCNSDVILQVEGTDKYLRAKTVGWGRHKSLKCAVDAVKKGFLWPFYNVKKKSGRAEVIDGKPYFCESGKDEWVEITW